MSWSYSGNPSDSKLNECRFLLGDTIQEEPILQDEEIQYLITSFTDENTLRYNLFKRAATLFARDIKRSLSNQSQDPTERLRYFNEQAEYYRRRQATAGVSLPKYSCDTVFKKGMHSNPPNDGGA